MGSSGQLLLTVTGFFLLIFLQGLKGAFLRRKKQLRQAFVPQRRVRKENKQRRQHRDQRVDQASQALPASAFWIVKNGFGHGGLTVNRMLWAAAGQFSVVHV